MIFEFGKRIKIKIILLLLQKANAVTCIVFQKGQNIVAGFDKKRLFYTQGDYGLLQCNMFR